MACTHINLHECDFALVDGNGVEVVATLVGAIALTFPARPAVWPSDGKGSNLRGVAPWKGEETPASVQISARIATIPGVATQVPTLVQVQTHGAGLTYVARHLWTRPGEYEPVRLDLRWSAGADAAATDTALIAEILAKTGLTGVASPTGTVTTAFPAGTNLVKVSETEGTGTSTITIAYTGGSLASELVFADTIQGVGQYGRLLSTTGSDDCHATHKTLHAEVRAGGRKWRFEHAARTAGSCTPDATGLQVQTTWESAACIPSAHT